MKKERHFFLHQREYFTWLLFFLFLLSFCWFSWRKGKQKKQSSGRLGPGRNLFRYRTAHENLGRWSLDVIISNFFRRRLGEMPAARESEHSAAQHSTAQHSTVEYKLLVLFCSEWYVE